MFRRVVSSAIGLLLVGWLAFSALTSWQVARSQAFLMPDIRLDDQLVVRPHPLLEPIVLEPFVGMRLEQVGDERIASVDDLRRLSQRGLLELWFRRPGSNEEPTLVSWAFTRQVPDLELSATLAISASTDASESVGLEPGDRVLSINDQPLESPGDYLPAMHRFVDSPRRLSVFRERTASRFELVVQVQDRWIAWAIYGAGVAFGLIGFVAYRLRPVSRSALAFLLFATTCSFLWLFRSIPFDNRLLVERHLVTILRLALPAASTILLLSFTPLRRIITRHRLAIGCATLVGVTLGVWNLTSYRGFALEGALALAPGRVLLGFTLGLIVLGVSSDWLSSLFGRRLLPIDRQRARVLRWATLLGLLPLTLYFLFHFDLQLWCELAVILFPLILAYATVRQNLFQINELLLEGLVYGGLLAGLSLTYASVVAGVVPLATAAFGGGESLVTFGLVAGTTLIALPVHTQLRLRLKRRFESSDLNAEALIGSETGSTITVGSPVELCREMASRIAAFLGTNSVRVFFRSPETDDWMAADSVASPPSRPLIEACRPLLNVIAERGQDVVRDVMDDDLLATEHERSIVNAMHALGASLAIPLTVSGDVWGVLAVGDKNTATNYTVGEIRSLRRLARELALGLYRAHVAFGVGSPPRRGVPLSNLFPRPPERIGPYDVERLLGEGGMALVYLATRDGRQVAVKVLNDRARQSLKLERRFQRECEILREIHHPNVLGVIDFSPRPEPYLVLEYCPLGTVRDRLRHESRLDVAEALRIARQAAQGLRAAHEMGVVHRDVNPRNLLRADEDLTKVADFGIAHWDREVALTTHELLGTPGYFSPEVCEGRSVDWRADQYALGITLFEMLAGRRPYGAPRPLEVLAMHVHAPVPDLRVELPGLEDRVAETAKAMMSKDPSDRFESYDALIEELDRCDSNAV